MPFTVTMPKLSPTMEEGSVVAWHKKVGDRVQEGDLLMEVATDKATVEFEALDEGWLRVQLVAEGEMAAVGQAIAVFTEEEDEEIAGYEPEGVAAPEEPPVVEEQGEEKRPSEAPKAAPKGGLAEPVMSPPPPLKEFHFPRGRSAGRIPASPLARRLARERNLDLGSVEGSGPSGRVMARDLERAQPAGLVSFGAGPEPSKMPGSYTEEPLTPMRKVVGQRLQESKTFVPHFYVTQEIDAEPMVALRSQLKEGGLKVSFNDLILRATALALREHPEINSGFNNQNQSLVRYETIDIAVAVSLEGGLITPIIRHADYKNVGQISVETKELAKRARLGKLEPEEYQGGSFTISNLGMFAVSEFIAVINPPQAAILAIGGISDQPVVKDGRVVPGKRLMVTLSSDHRVIDGVDAAKFLQTVRHLLENPALLTL